MVNLDKYPDPMTPEEVAEVFRCKAVTVPRLKGLKKSFLYNGRKGLRYFKEDVINYMNSKREEVREDASKQEKRHRQVGIQTLLPWEELQKARLGYAR